MPPMLSIVTVNLNNVAGLRATAASILAQSMRGFEWLIVDGGSHDGSQEVIGAMATHVAAWSSEPDGGVYDAMNKGLARATGEWVIFMNAGDRFADRDSVAWICAALEAQAGCDLLLAGTMLEMPSGRRLYRPPRHPAFVRFGPPAYHQATVFRRHAHLAVPYDPRLRISADYGTIAALIAGGARAARLDRPVAVRHCDPASLSERHTLWRLGDFVHVQRRVLRRAWPQVAVSLGRQILVDLAYRLLRGPGHDKRR